MSAVQKSYRKNILREMKGNASRMVSLFGIVALGVMMLTGLMSIAPSMRSAAQKYYVQQNVFDLRVLSTLGLSDQDIAAIAATPGVEAVMPVKTLDLEANWQGQEERIVVQLQALQQDPAADTDANMNRLVLRSGRMPQAANECVVHVMGYQAEIAEGTVLTLPEDTEGTKHKEYTVVGLVQDPQHISTDKESSTVGNGQLNYIAYVLDGELTADYYTACYIKAENAGRYDNYSREYQEAVAVRAVRNLATVMVEVAHGRCLQRGVADRGDVALNGLDGQAAELLEQTFVVGEHVGGQRGSKRGTLLGGGVNLSLQVGGLGAGGLGICLHALLELGDDCLRAGLAVERLLMGDNDVLASVLNLVQTLGQGGKLILQVLHLAVIRAVDVTLLGSLDGVVSLDLGGVEVVELNVQILTLGVELGHLGLELHIGLALGSELLELRHIGKFALVAGELQIDLLQLE